MGSLALAANRGLKSVGEVTPPLSMILPLPAGEGRGEGELFDYGSHAPFQLHELEI